MMRASFDLVSVLLFPPILDISIGCVVSLRESRSAILLVLRFNCDPQSFTARRDCR